MLNSIHFYFQWHTWFPCEMLRTYPLSVVFLSIPIRPWAQVNRRPPIHRTLIKDIRFYFQHHTFSTVKLCLQHVSSVHWFAL
jgi:hypothetical protein